MHTVQTSKQCYMNSQHKHINTLEKTASDGLLALGSILSRKQAEWLYPYSRTQWLETKCIHTTRTRLLNTQLGQDCNTLTNEACSVGPEVVGTISYGESPQHPDLLSQLACLLQISSDNICSLANMKTDKFCKHSWFLRSKRMVYLSHIALSQSS